MPLRAALTDPHTQELGTLSAAVARARSLDDYAAIYRDAVQLAEGIVRELDARIEQMQRDGMRLDDPNEIRQRIAGVPRREADKARTDAKAVLQKLQREWLDRSRRQLDQVTSQCAESGQGVKIAEFITDDGLKLCVDSTWWAQYTGFVARCCDEWSNSFADNSEAGIRSAVGSAISQAISHAGGRAVGTPERTPPPTGEARLAAETPVKEIEIAHTGKMLMNAVRANIMAVGIFGTVLTVLATLAGKFLGDSNSSSNSMLLRGGLVLLVLPFSIVLGLQSARTQRELLREKGIAAQKQALAAFIKSELDKSLERHRKALERWHGLRAEAWAQAIDSWWDRTVEPRLAEYDSMAGDAVRDAKLAQAKFNEDLGMVRALRTQLAQNVMFELKRRNRELSASVIAATGSESVTSGQ